MAEGSRNASILVIQDPSLRNPATTIAVRIFPFALDLLKHLCGTIAAQGATAKAVANNGKMVFLVECDLGHRKEAVRERILNCAFHRFAFPNRIAWII